MMDRIIATVTIAEQKGPESWSQRRVSREFAVNRSIQDVLKWAESMGLENPRISDVVLREVTCRSVGFYLPPILTSEGAKHRSLR